MSQKLIIAVALVDGKGSPVINHSLITSHYRLSSLFIRDIDIILFRIIISTVEFKEDLLSFPSYTPIAYIDIPLKRDISDIFEKSSFDVIETSLINGVLGVEVSKKILIEFHRVFADLVINASQHEGLIEINNDIKMNIQNHLDKILEENANKE